MLSAVERNLLDKKSFWLKRRVGFGKSNLLRQGFGFI